MQTPQSRSEHRKARKLVHGVVSYAKCLSKDIPPPVPHGRRTLKSMVVEFLNTKPLNDAVVEIFLRSYAPHLLVKLYDSSRRRSNREEAAQAIREFIYASKRTTHDHDHSTERFVLRYCSLLDMAERTHRDPLYSLCYTTLRAFDDRKGRFKELVADLLLDLDFCAKLSTSFSGPSSILVGDFNAFLTRHGEEEELVYLHGGVFLELLRKLETCLLRIENKHAVVMIKQNRQDVRLQDCQYLSLVIGLAGVSEFYSDCEEEFWKTLERRKTALSCLVLMHVKSGDDCSWIHEHTELFNSEARRHVAMMMLPKLKYYCQRPHEMLISRSHLLEESFEYIAHANPQSLRSGLSVVFNNEEATGPGVLREWFFLVCQEIVNPLKSLFLACPNDRRRFFPNPASGVDPLHLDYFCFFGRVIALALMHKVQVGITFDRIFSIQLAGPSISLEDIQDADPDLYRSCQQILEMDSETVDQDVLGLTFVSDIEVFGTRKGFELFPGGRSKVVNSKNRNKFVDSLIKHHFVTAISEQIAQFAQGFSDIMSCQCPHRSFFRCLDLEDLDSMLHGSESAISVDDWKAHTEYHGFEENDPQISWFWEIIGLMSTEQKRVLLFFWTSIKYLPVEGFSGLASRLCINKTAESCDRLPSSHTCFNQLCLPTYVSFYVMRDRLNIITQEHVSCSFGFV